MGSIAQVAMALDLNLGNLSLTDPYHPYIWTPVITPPSGYSLNTSPRYGSDSPANSSSSEQRKFSLQIYRGDGLDDLRKDPHRYHGVKLPEEDVEAYGVSVKQRF